LEVGGHTRAIEGAERSDQKILRHEQKQLLQKALAKLSGAQRKAFVLSQYRDLSNKEVADIMELSVSAVESLLYRARVRLQDYLKKSLK
jgi:RNA polymerase sigma-70 factor (ECF subfamily)